MHIPKFTKYIINFYLVFIIISLAGYFIINYRVLSIVTIVFFSLYVISLILGSYIGYGIPTLKLRKTIPINIDCLLIIIFIISFITTILNWIYIINHYGTLTYILSHGTAIREETIGDGIQIKSTLLSYLSSLGMVGPSLSLSAYYFQRKFKYLIFFLLFLINIVLGDLQTFGRIGTLFTIFIFISYVFICVKHIPYLKYLFYCICLFVILMVPKFIRAGNSLDGIGDRYSGCLTTSLPSFMEPIVTVYAYYFSGIYAFDYLLEKPIIYSHGLRNFSALYNLLNRIFEFQDGRNSIIANVAYVPFDTNIYTLAGELFMDWGIFGLSLGALLFGIGSSYLFRYNGIFGLALKFTILTWLFESAIYNIFSFGGFMISILILILLTVFFNGKNINNNSKL